MERQHADCCHVRRVRKYDGQYPVSMLEAVLESVREWDKEDIYSLLGYVPADTGAMLMTTRHLSGDDPRKDKILSKADAVFSDEIGEPGALTELL